MAIKTPSLPGPPARGPAARLRRGALSLVLVAVATAAGAQPAVPGVAARINGVAIGMERLERNFDEYLRESRINIAAVRHPQRLKALRRETLELLIDQELLWQAAQRDGLLADDAAVEQAVAAVRAGFGTPQAWEERLRREGFTAPGYAQHLRRLLSAQRWLDAAQAGAGVVDDAAVQRFWQENQAAFEARGRSQAEAEAEIRRHLQAARERAAAQEALQRLRAQATIERLLPP